MKRFIFNEDLFSTKLFEKQQAYKLSVRTAAKEIGISASTLSRLNRAEFLPDVYTYFRCCQWLKIEMNYFFTFER